MHPETRRQLPFDFLIGNTIIELDGPQHFEPKTSSFVPATRNSYLPEVKTIPVERDISGHEFTRVTRPVWW
jgi:hypothetical protein